MKNTKNTKNTKNMKAVKSTRSMTMTKGKTTPTFTGLKVSLVTGSLIASVIGARLLALKDGTVYTLETPVEPAIVDQTGGNAPGAYPTVYAPDLTIPQDLPPVGANGSSNPPSPEQSGAGAGGDGQSASILPPVPTAVYVEPMPMPVQPVTSSSSSR
jgi:hypothetical protein